MVGLGLLLLNIQAVGVWLKSNQWQRKLKDAFLRKPETKSLIIYSSYIACKIFLAIAS